MATVLLETSRAIPMFCSLYITHYEPVLHGPKQPFKHLCIVLLPLPCDGAHALSETLELCHCLLAQNVGPSPWDKVKKFTPAGC